MLSRFKDRKLKSDEKKLVSDIELVGWAIMNIKDEPGKTGWAFTVGLYETYKHPEVLLFGLKPESRMGILNWIGQNVRDGKPFTVNQEHDWVLDNYKCWSRPVRKKWYRDMLGYAIWFYRTPDKVNNFPCVQCLWPARDGSYPWQEKRGYACPQPLLYEKEFVAARMMRFASEDELMKFDWPFPFGQDMRAFVSRCVVEDGAPIVSVFHNPKGDWQLIGPVDDPNKDGCKLSCFHCCVERDPTLKKLAGLPYGFRAWRESKKHKWHWEKDDAKD